MYPEVKMKESQVTCLQRMPAKKPDFMQASTAVDSNTTNGIAEVTSKMVTSSGKVLNKIKYNILLFYILWHSWEF